MVLINIQMCCSLRTRIVTFKIRWTRNRQSHLRPLETFIDMKECKLFYLMDPKRESRKCFRSVRVMQCACERVGDDSVALVTFDQFETLGSSWGSWEASSFAEAVNSRKETGIGLWPTRLLIRIQRSPESWAQPLDSYEVGAYWFTLTFVIFRMLGR